MAVIQSSTIADLTNTTLRHLGPPRFEQAAQAYQNYPLFARMFRRDRVTLQSGYGIQRVIMTKHNDTARHTGFGAPNQVKIDDVSNQLTIDWRHAENGWGGIYQLLIMNTAGSKIVDHIELKRASCMLDIAEEVEQKGWSAPSGSGDTVNPHGVPYWVPLATGDPSFQGGNPSGFSNKGGIDASTVTNWNSWAGAYTNMTKTDGVKKMREALRQTRFMSPFDLPTLSAQRVSADTYRIYVNLTTIQTLEELGEGQNENLGRDLASMDGKMMIHGHPIIWVSYLDDQTTNPVYGINHSKFHCYGLKGDFLREHGPYVSDDSVDVFIYMISVTYDFLCFNVREQWALRAA